MTPLQNWSSNAIHGQFRGSIDTPLQWVIAKASPFVGLLLFKSLLFFVGWIHMFSLFIACLLPESPTVLLKSFYITVVKTIIAPQLTRNSWYKPFPNGWFILVYGIVLPTWPCCRPVKSRLSGGFSASICARCVLRPSSDFTWMLGDGGRPLWYSRDIHGGFHGHGGTQKWMVYNGKSH